MRKKFIIIVVLVALPLIFVNHIYSQQFIFSHDFLNLEKLDPSFFKAYSLIEISDAWDLLNQSGLILSDIKIGIIDSGIDASNGIHPEFQDISLGALSAKLFRDDHPKGHGTQVAGIIGANNISFPDPKGYAFPQMNGILSGIHNLDYSLELGRSPVGVLSLFGAAFTIDKLTKKRVKVINMSFGTRVSAAPPLLSIALPVFTTAFVKNKDVLFITAAGNFEFDFLGIDLEGVDAILVAPANLGGILDNVITVGATDTIEPLVDTRASFSNFGPAVTLAAPGIAVYSPAPRGKGNFPPNTKNYDQFFSGTSSSAPMVTGVAAILKALEPEYQKHNPDLVVTPEKIKEILQLSADPIDTRTQKEREEGKPGKLLGQGCFDPANNPQNFTGCRLNAHRAVAWLLPPTPVELFKPVIIPK